MKKRDVWVVLAIVFVAAALLLLSKFNFFPTATGPMQPFITATIMPQVTALPAQTQKPMPSESAAVTLAPAACYLLITIGDVVFEPYPMLNERDLPITQVDGQQNVVHITQQGFSMASATCDNQDCVHQGEVTLQNRDVRILGNQVVCLPNQVMLELLTPEEAMIVWENAYGQK